MNLPEAIRTVRWMVRDTLRQSLATKLFWVMTATTVVATLFCFSVDVKGDPRSVTLEYEVPAVLPPEEILRLGMEALKREGKLPDPVPPAGTPEGDRLREQARARGAERAEIGGARIITGEMSLGFGVVKVPVGRSRDDSVRAIQLWLVAAAADTLGVLLALLWTAGFLPTFLEPQAATVLLAKPAPRWAVLLGKYLGVLLFVGLHATAFIAGTWLALGIKTQVWFPAYWLAIPLLVVNFGVFYAVSAYLAVWTRSTVASAFGVLLFWLLCWIMNYTHHRLTAFPIEGMTPTAQTLLEIGYWVLPKPLDLGGIFFEAMKAEGFTAKVEELAALQAAGQFSPGLSVLASAAFAVVTLALAAYEFEMTDY